MTDMIKTLFILVIMVMTIVIIFVTNDIVFGLSNTVQSEETYLRSFYRQRADFEDIYSTTTPLKPLVSRIKKITDVTAQDVTAQDIFILNPSQFSPVRDQGRCGACYIFVICSLLSASITVRVGKFGKTLNAQQLLSCFPASGKPCEGDTPEDVLLWMDKTGFEISVGDDYSEVPSKCVKTTEGFSVGLNSVESLCDFIDRESIAEPTLEETAKLKKNITRMKQQLMTNGSFFASITAYSDLFNFIGDRVYEHGESSSTTGGHAVTVIGWCDAGVDKRLGFEKGYWVCKNSWGDQWAPAYDFPGHFAMLMGRNECGIESRSGSAAAAVKRTSGTNVVPPDLTIGSYNELIGFIVESRKQGQTFE